MKEIKSAISYAIYNQEKNILVVKRPKDDKDLPDVWGLPAGSLKENESFEDAVLRSGKEKLGVTLKIINEINEGDIERENYILHMKLFEVTIIEGTPSVPQDYPDVTQYQEFKWGTADNLVEAAKMGSLCSTLYLKSINKEF